jgi:predicted esterase
MLIKLALAEAIRNGWRGARRCTTQIVPHLVPDRSIPVRTTVENLAALSAAGKPFEWKTYPGLGHGLSPAVWSDIDAWVRGFRE